MGLAEYTSANFFSEDTIIFREFPYPLISDNTPRITAVHENSLFETKYEREYYLKTCCGETNGGQGYLLAAVDGLDFYRQKYIPGTDLLKYPVLDGNVYRDYANFLLPRAVGYSTEIINYFFRGRLGVKGGAFTNAARDTVRLKVANLTPDEAAAGAVTVAARYRVPGDDTIYSQVSSSVGLGPLPTDIDNAGFNDYTLSGPVPEDAEDLEFVVAFKGTLGAEEDTAVIGQVYKPTYMLIVQDRATLNSTPAVHNISYDDEGDLCTEPDAPEDCIHAPYHFAGSGFWKEWDMTRQFTSGHFITNEPIQKITVRFEDYCLLFSWCSLNEPPALTVNGQFIEGGTWFPGTTPESPKTWTVKPPNFLSYSIDGTVYIDPYYDSLVLEVTMVDGRTYSLGLVFYSLLDHIQSKRFSLMANLPYYSNQLVTSTALARLEVWNGFWETPERYAANQNHIQVEQISGQGPIEWNNPREETGVYGEDDTPYIHTYSENFYVKTAGNFTAYSQGKGFLCYENRLPFSFEGGCKDGPWTVYSNLSVPSLQGPFTISGKLRRLYTEEELATLSFSGLPPESYHVTLD